MLGFGLKVTALGISIVFVALTLLMFIIMLQSSLFAVKPKKAVEPKKEVTNNKPEEVKVEEKEDDTEIAAVIAAAVQAFSGQQVIIKTITRIPGNSGAIWSTAGRTESMNLR